MTIRVGVPTEIKPQEGRVALTPAAASELVKMDARVCLQAGTGNGSGYPDEAYAAVGVELVNSAESVYASSDIVLKVKEPVGPELQLLQPHHKLFSFLHLAPNPELTARLCDIGLTAIAFETVVEGNNLPILQPMSEIAGKIAVQVGAHLLHTPQGGAGKLLGGVPGVGRGDVVVLGAGHAGGTAARLAAAMGARVTVFDLNPQRLGELQAAAPNINARYANAEDLRGAIHYADLLIGAVLLPGAEAPRLVNREDVKTMSEGSVVVDISVDQGGCIETTRPTDYNDPTYSEEGVTHFCVANMPGAVPRTATQALSGAMLPYLKKLLQSDWRENEVLRKAINVERGRVVHPALIR